MKERRDGSETRKRDSHLFSGGKLKLFVEYSGDFETQPELQILSESKEDQENLRPPI